VGSASGLVILSFGTNVIALIVTAQDSIICTTYGISVTRSAGSFIWYRSLCDKRPRST